jgi:uncharacterized membrane protein
VVLGIRRPSGDPGHLGDQLIHGWPSCLAYAVAFVYIGVIWLNQHHVFTLRWQRP